MQSTDLNARSFNQIIRENKFFMDQSLMMGDTEMALEMLNMMTSLMSVGDPCQELVDEPEAFADPKWDALYKTAIGYALRATGSPVPEWTQVEPLDEEWFPWAPVTENYREMTRRQTPEEFAKVNIFIRNNALTSS